MPFHSVRIPYRRCDSWLHTCRSAHWSSSKWQYKWSVIVVVHNKSTYCNSIIFFPCLDTSRERCIFVLRAIGRRREGVGWQSRAKASLHRYGDFILSAAYVKFYMSKETYFITISVDNVSCTLRNVAYRYWSPGLSEEKTGTAGVLTTPSWNKKTENYGERHIMQIWCRSLETFPWSRGQAAETVQEQEIEGNIRDLVTSSVAP